MARAFYVQPVFTASSSVARLSIELKLGLVFSSPAVSMKGTKVTWRWSGKDMHNVAVTKGPVKFRSSLKSSGTYSKTVRPPGTYTIVCTIHQPDMKMKLRVTR